MASHPPPTTVTTTTTPTPTNNNNNNEDWRSSVSQEYRNAEVREIAKVLAALEPGATFQSKLMLAMRFEKSIIDSSNSLSDYRKKLTKRLKKLQKNYKPPVADDSKLSNSSQEQQQQSQRILDMARTHGEALKFITDNEKTAVQLMQERHGSERAKHLQQHLHNAGQWAQQLDIFTKHRMSKSITKEQLDRLQNHLDQRTENVRSHVVKLTHPDMFLQEQLKKLESEFPPEASVLLAKSTQRRFERLGWEEFKDAKAVLLSSLEKAQEPIPPLSRRQNNRKEEEALLHLEKLRAASQALTAYLAVEHKETLAIQRNVPSRCHGVAQQSNQYIREAIREANSTNQSEEENQKVTLEDIWKKVMEAPSTTTTDITNGNHSNSNSSSTEMNDASCNAASLEQLAPSPVVGRKKAARVIRSRVLLTPGRKIPANLLPAIQRKRAKLVQPFEGYGAHLVLEFDQAFTMKIYLVPLLVRFHPTPQSSAGADTTVSIWGVSAPRKQLHHVVTQRLRHAAAHATRVLRLCFAAARNNKTNSEFEIEIAEGGALLQFLQLARMTYMPKWQEDDL